MFIQLPENPISRSKPRIINTDFIVNIDEIPSLSGREENDAYVYFSNNFSPTLITAEELAYIKRELFKQICTIEHSPRYNPDGSMVQVVEC